ncbi:hypothetical protein PSDVSF_28900 [Pseudodesulfovibrio sediminis]|uniref:HesB/YadR/YfhF-family protein n=1 Tax=Pseudodesulfovibrio sediminis TaxID=2810563 RepID=A0ABM7P9H9_9BACT|nr:hypothetical protein PSDVSF_28900 [Pseudodesulfovibrio sediminis]
MFEAGGFTFLIDKELQTQTGNVKVDMTYYGFVVESENPVGGGEGASCGCSSASSCGSAGSGGCNC